ATRAVCIMSFMFRAYLFLFKKGRLNQIMKILSPAKINLRLKLEGRRNDNYHLLSMLNVLCDLQDEIEILPTDNKQIKISVYPDEIEIKPEANHVYRATTAFLKSFNIDEGFE